VKLIDQKYIVEKTIKGASNQTCGKWKKIRGWSNYRRSN
jgi:hypothetical protein